VTIIAILNIIGGVIMLFAGLFIFPFINLSMPQSEFQQQLQVLTIAVASGAFMLALGIAGLVIAYGLIKARGWAWTAAVVLSIIVLIMSVVSIATGNIGSIISLAINGVILYYLYRRHVKAYFEKTVSTSGTASATQA
jgi:uncharacterized membrane protein (DUF2068 family)